jgi:hypothetical protein
MLLLQGNAHLVQDRIVIIDTSSLNTKIEAKENSIIRLVRILIITIHPAKVVVEQVKQKALVAIFLIARVGPIKLKI